MPVLGNLDSTRKVALVLAHPGHEVLIWRWIELVKPRVLILTDGSGSNQVPRISVSRRLLQDAGAQPGCVFGDTSDMAVYERVLQSNRSFFQRLTEQIAADLIEQRIECVVGDAAEGKIMTHDLFREVRRIAVGLAEMELGWKIEHREFPLDSHPATFPSSMETRLRLVRLNHADLQRKLAVARGFTEIRSFVDQGIAAFGESAYATECLFPCSSRSLLPTMESPLPYELHGERRVREGGYAQAIRYLDHVQPIIESLQDVLAQSSIGMVA